MDRDLCSMTPEQRERLRADAKAKREAADRAELDKRAGRVVLPAEIYKPNPNGYGFPVESLPVGFPWAVRFCGPLVAYLMHFGKDEHWMCTGKDCPRCADKVRRHCYAAADVLAMKRDAWGNVLRDDEGKQITARSIHRFPASAVKELYYGCGLGELLELDVLPSGEETRLAVRQAASPVGHLVEFHRRGPRSAVKVEVRQTAAPYVLPEPCNVRGVLMRVHDVQRWPTYEAFDGAEEDNPAILKFRSA